MITYITFRQVTLCFSSACYFNAGRTRNFALAVWKIGTRTKRFEARKCKTRRQSKCPIISLFKREKYLFEKYLQSSTGRTLLLVHRKILRLSSLFDYFYNDAGTNRFIIYHLTAESSNAEHWRRVGKRKEKVEKYRDWNDDDDLKKK